MGLCRLLVLGLGGRGGGCCRLERRGERERKVISI